MVTRPISFISGHHKLFTCCPPRQISRERSLQANIVVAFAVAPMVRVGSDAMASVLLDSGHPVTSTHCDGRHLQENLHESDRCRSLALAVVGVASLDLPHSLAPSPPAQRTRHGPRRWNARVRLSPSWVERDRR